MRMTLRPFTSQEDKNKVPFSLIRPSSFLCLSVGFVNGVGIRLAALASFALKEFFLTHTKANDTLIADLATPAILFWTAIADATILIILVFLPDLK